ncbi:unnamed protein product [Medioppia subpectinata]|uniref:Uncharacterized protein n=1 Tax=Medioppia subpectinata TaxID=1979941 RepID=A0A7R9KHD2_9ACAR|nr:unnamed protein product [Medioppia subpectinata]CAG2103589.1 unnamed protein product [Medioppia subpectinata]
MSDGLNKSVAIDVNEEAEPFQKEDKVTISTNKDVTDGAISSNAATVVGCLCCPVICAGSIVFIALIIFLALGLQIIFITMGSIYLHDCPIAPSLPILMIVNGVFGLLTFQTKKDMVCVVYQARFPDFEDQDSEYYCHQNLYLSAYWILNILLSVMAIVLGLALFP